MLNKVPDLQNSDHLEVPQRSENDQNEQNSPIVAWQERLRNQLSESLVAGSFSLVFNFTNFVETCDRGFLEYKMDSI